MNNLNKFLRDFDLDKFMKQGILPVIGIGFVLLVATFLGPLGVFVGMFTLIAIVTVVLISMGEKE